MHIEPGYIIPAKIALANGCAVAALVYVVKDIIKPKEWLNTLATAVFFSLFMQSFHLSVGPSELHFIGASLMYLLLGFRATLVGFALGLVMQAFLFDPQDMAHLGVNCLSLIAPLIVAHTARGKQLLAQGTKAQWRDILQWDALYYAGVTTMVGFWLATSTVETPFTAWLTFASSYLAIIAIEPILCVACLRLHKSILIFRCSNAKTPQHDSHIHAGE